MKRCDRCGQVVPEPSRFVGLIHEVEPLRERPDETYLPNVTVATYAVDQYGTRVLVATCDYRPSEARSVTGAASIPLMGVDPRLTGTDDPS